MLTQHHPPLRGFSELILLAYLRILHVAQQYLCVNHYHYPESASLSSHRCHHVTVNMCNLVVHQLRCVDRSRSCGRWKQGYRSPSSPRECEEDERIEGIIFGHPGRKGWRSPITGITVGICGTGGQPRECKLYMLYIRAMILTTAYVAGVAQDAITCRKPERSTADELVAGGRGTKASFAALDANSPG
eukprot:4840074-Amphidinium_carterae.1